MNNNKHFFIVTNTISDETMTKIVKDLAFNLLTPDTCDCVTTMLSLEKQFHLSLGLLFDPMTYKRNKQSLYQATKETESPMVHMANKQIKANEEFEFEWYTVIGYVTDELYPRDWYYATADNSWLTVYIGDIEKRRLLPSEPDYSITDAETSDQVVEFLLDLVRHHILAAQRTFQ